MKRRAVIYARASLDMTGEGRSVERQTDACRTLLEARGCEVIDVIQDNSISAYGEKRRPGWQRVLGLIESGDIDYVAAWHLDRMTRSMVDLEQLIVLTERTGVGILTATGDMDLTTDVGRMVARILAAVARAEVERKAARQKLANRQLAVSGKPWSGGARPFGYAEDQMQLVPEEAEAIQWAAKQALDGATMTSIARDWTERGLVSSRAKYSKDGWSARGVKAVLVSPRYAGLRQYRGESLGEGTWPAILDMDTHLALCMKLNDPARKRGGDTVGGKTIRNLLTNIIRCDVCGSGLNGASFGTNTKLIYSCRKRHVNPPRDECERIVQAELVALLSMPDFVRTLVTENDDDLAEVRTDLDALQRRAHLLAEGFAMGTVEESTFLTVSKSLRERITARENELRAVATGSLLTGLDVGTKKFAKQWGALSFERKRVLIAAFLDVVALKKDAPRNVPWDERWLRVTQKQQSPALT